MSIYRCGICEQYKDADIHGCYESPYSEYDCICEYCDTELPIEMLIKLGRLENE